MEANNQHYKDIEIQNNAYTKKDENLDLLKRFNKDPRLQQKAVEIMDEEIDCFRTAGIRYCPGLLRGKSVLERAAEELEREDEMNAQNRKQRPQ